MNYCINTKKKLTKIYKRYRGCLITALLLPWLASCASMGGDKLSKKDNEVQQHELFSGDVRNVSVMKKKMKSARSSTRFDKKRQQKMSKEELAQHRKRQHIQKGDMALHSGNSDVALYEYVRALVEDSRDIQLYYKVGILHESRHNVDLATLAYQRALELEPDFVLGLERMGKIKLAKRQYADARVFFEKTIAVDRLRIDSLNETATVSPDLAGKGVDHHSPFHAYTGMGVIEDLSKNHQSALAYYHKALLIRPDSAAAESNLGYSHYLSENLEKAESHFKRAISKDKSYGKAWRNLALIYVRKGKYTQAVNLLIEHSKDEPAAYNTVGYICMMDGKYEQAEKFFNRAIDLSPVYFEIAVQNRDMNRRRHSQTVYEPLNE